MTIRNIIILILAVLISIPAFASQRVKNPLKMNDLTQIDSPSYVPYPYPKSDLQVIEDLKYAISQLFSEFENEIRASKKNVPKIDNFLPSFIQPQSRIKIKNIIKVKNKITDLPDEYSFLIVLHDPITKNNIRVAMQADGLLYSIIYSTDKVKVKDLKSKDNLIDHFVSKGHFKAKDVKKLEWVAYDLMINNILYPFSEITLYDGSVYFMDHKDNLYRKQSEESINSEAIYQNTTNVVYSPENEKVIVDSITDKRIYLERL